MSRNLLRTKAALKAQWLAANRRALELRRKASEADAEAGTADSAEIPGERES